MLSVFDHMCRSRSSDPEDDESHREFQKEGEETGAMEFQFDSEFPRLFPRSQPLFFPENGLISQLVFIIYRTRTNQLCGWRVNPAMKSGIRTI